MTLTIDERNQQHEIATFIVKQNPHRYDGFIFLNDYQYRVHACFHRKGTPTLWADLSQRDDLTFGSKYGFYTPFHRTLSASNINHLTDVKVWTIVRFKDGVIAGANMCSPACVLVTDETDDVTREAEPMAFYPWDRFVVLYHPNPQ